MLTPPNEPTCFGTSLDQSVAETAPPAAAPKTAKLPLELADVARRHARRISRKYQRLFLADPRLKERDAAAIRSELPPRPRPPGQPARQQITEAEKLLRQVRRQHPEEDTPQHLDRVCAAVFSDWRQRTPQPGARIGKSSPTRSDPAERPGVRDRTAPPRKSCKTIPAEIVFGK